MRYIKFLLVYNSLHFFYKKEFTLMDMPHSFEALNKCND